MLKIKYKKLAPEAYAPVRAHLGDAGFDLAPVKVEVEGSLVKCSFGLAVEIPPGHAGLVFPRSSIYKTQWRLSNSVGLIDSSYRGELKAYFDIKDITDEFYSEFSQAEWKEWAQDNGYKPGERCCQLVIIELPQVAFVEVTSLSDSDRGHHGFGSSGKDMAAIAKRFDLEDAAFIDNPTRKIEVRR